MLSDRKHAPVNTQVYLEKTIYPQFIARTAPVWYLQGMKTALKDILQDRQISQTAFADALKISRGYMSLLLNGKRDPSPALLEQMADVLQLHIGQIFEGTSPAATGFAEDGVAALGMPDGQKSQLLASLGIKSRTASLMEAKRSFPDLLIAQGDRLGVELRYDLRPNDLVVLNVLDDDGNATTTIARWLEPWYVFADGHTPPMRADNSGQIAIMGKIVAASRIY